MDQEMLSGCPAGCAGYAQDAIFLGGEMVMLQKSRLLALGLFLGAGAYATSVNFSFDTQTIGSTTITGLSSLATSAQIQTYMNAVLAAAGCSGCMVTVATGSSGGGNSMGAVA